MLLPLVSIYGHLAVVLVKGYMFIGHKILQKKHLAEKLIFFAFVTLVF